MSSINPQIDAAVVLMKVRAAEFDETKTMDGVDVGYLLECAFDNLSRATADCCEARSPIGHPYQRKNIIDTMNLCALALSLLPSAERGTK